MISKASDPSAPSQWDVFCHVIDNYGDLGVCWRLASQLAAAGQHVRLWVDDARALSWMAPDGVAGVQVRGLCAALAAQDPPSDVLVEAFGCDIPHGFLVACAAKVSAGAKRPVWINLEYLSAESWVARHHRLPSPVLQGPAAGWTKWFFYPGFTENTGGLLREATLAQSQQAFDRTAWRASHAGPAAAEAARWVSLFCYEPPALSDWLMQCESALPEPTQLLVTPGRAQAAVRASEHEISRRNGLQRLSAGHSQLSILNMSALPQTEYDALLWACDLNFVRGEDSLVRALWAGQPFVWQIYPQDDGAHGPKLEAFLEWMQAPQSLRTFHAVWNGLSPGTLPCVTQAVLHEWGICARAARARLLQQNDLLIQLLGFCLGQR